LLDKDLNGTIFSEFGDPEAPALLLIHGLGLNKDVWQWQGPDLSRDHYVVSYDLYGHGKSNPPPMTPSLRMFAAQAQALLDHLGFARATVIGFSLGGMIARRMVQDHPDKVARIVVLHSPHQRSALAQQAILDRVELARSEGPAATVEAALDRWFTAPFRRQNPQMMALVRSWILQNKTEIYHTIYRVLAEGIDEITTPEPAISCPALIVTGDQDFGNGPEMSQAIARDIVGAVVRILPGLRHMALAEEPTAMTHMILSFLAETRSAAS
jgi:pimeloyl-ACP methyl ester carboxylesterase